jgi:tripartite-type tricarboxylate transporter receptor subunit TctC
MQSWESTMVRSMLAALTGLVMLGPGAACAQSYPDRPIKLVVGFTAGGIADHGARVLADHITRVTGQTVVVENRAAAAGTLGLDAVAKAAPDGLTLGVALNGQLVINPFVQKQMPLDVSRDLVAVAAIGEAPQMIAINAEVPAKTLNEFIALAKAKPNTLHYGSAGPGSLPHLSAAEFARMAGIELVHVPYRGATQATTDLIGGQIELLSSSIGGLRAGVEAGKVRLLLTATERRLPYLPELPTSAEAGLPGYRMTVWQGVVAPAGTPQPILDRIHALVTGMLQDEAARKRLASVGIDPMVMSQAGFAAFVKAEHARWQRIVKYAGVEAQ